jgi:AcrR family transcriptional regulator
MLRMDEEHARSPGAQSPEARILEAAIRCIEIVGLKAVTTRRIAELAGVNSAAVNYYYRTKDNLLQKALSQTMENAFGDWERIIADAALPLPIRLRSILGELIEGAQKFPNLVKAHLHGPLMEGNYETEFARRFRSFTVQVQAAAAPLFTGLEGGELELRITAIFSAAFFAGLLPGLFGEAVRGGLADAAGRLRYVDLLIRRFTHTPGG